MRKISHFIFFLFFSILLISSSVYGATTLQGGVAIEKVPKEFYGTWRVTSKLVSTNNPEIFKNTSVDLWNLSRVGDVITLDNPFSGAHASIMVDEVSGQLIKFKKIGDYDSKKLTDAVALTLGKDSFTGVNNLKLDTISDIDGHVIKSEVATYRLTGDKISGESIK